MLELREITHTFDHKPILNNISFYIQAGEILSILGKSGSGKSTLLNIIAGLIQADSGEIILNNQIQNFIAPEHRNIAMMFQDFALFPHLNVLDNAAFGLKMRGIPTTQAREIAYRALKEVNLEHLSMRRIKHLSGGEQQRTALARALAVKPKLLLLDEPFSALDSELRQHLRNQIADLIKKYEIPAILVTHDPDEACSMAQHIALLANGKIIQYGSPNELLMRPISVQAANLLGCINVNTQYYIPPNAIHIHEQIGELCPITHAIRQSTAWKIQFNHPKFGQLNTFYIHSHTPPSHCHIHIDTEQIIYFSP